VPAANSIDDRMSDPTISISVPKDGRKRIIIIGGGVSGLTAAYELTRTPELRERHSVTIAQMGFRLGGKLASGRNLQMGARNEEHGLHVWFGLYDNAFALWREVFESWPKPENSPIHGLADVIEPCRFAPFGRPQPGAYAAWTVLFPENSGTPGDDAPIRPTMIVEHLLDMVRTRAQMLWTDLQVMAPSASVESPGGPTGWDRVWSGAQTVVDAALGAIFQLLQPALRSISAGLQPAVAERIHALLAGLADALLPVVEAATRDNPVTRSHVYYTLDFCLACLCALFDPRFCVSVDWNLDRLNHRELRELLQACGLARETSDEFVLIRGSYDAFFQYEHGDVARPNFEAGTALRIMLRALLLYRGAAFWLFKIGVGEGLISPLYRVLRERGVEFRFFHQLVDIELSGDQAAVERLWFVEQARPIAQYEPTFECRGLECWPTEPRWEQLHDGDMLREQGDHFESSRCNPHASRRAFVRGQDFDAVVLALPLGAMTTRGGAPSPVAALASCNPKFAQLCEGINLAPSIAAQIWFNRPLWKVATPRSAMLSWAYPWDIWADMSATLTHEDWPQADAPGAALYLCATTTSRVPSSSDPVRVKHEERLAASTALAEQLRLHGRNTFPALQSDTGELDWSSLHAPAGLVGADRLDAQYVRVNADPSDLCDCAAVGNSSLRLEADASGLENLVLCGTWARTGLNTTCVEAAVMAGMGAARAIDSEIRAPRADRFMQAPGRSP
jgi:uncharacterized protein with NAD-binding domain and iron-sulfur cluster